eukprot:tig00020592_g11633.t1
MRVIKLTGGWPAACEARMAGLRAAEMRLIRRAALLKCASSVLSALGPLAVAVSTFACFTAGMGRTLTAATAFTALQLFANLRLPFQTVPSTFNQALEALEAAPAPLISSPSRPCLIMSTGAQARVSLNRIQKFLLLPETRWLEEGSEGAQLLPAPGGPEGDVTSLLGAILGDLELASGAAGVARDAAGGRPALAYAAQEAWISNGTVRENILYGEEYDEERYGRVVEGCALLPDLALWPERDGTVLGERGVNLRSTSRPHAGPGGSGGQRQRVALARAAYSRAELVLLDDCLSAGAHAAFHTALTFDA